MYQIHAVSGVDGVETVAIVCPHSNTTENNKEGYIHYTANSLEQATIDS